MGATPTTRGKRILFLAHTLPYPLDAGAKIRAYYMLRHLASRHRVTLLSFVRPADKAESVAHLSRFCEAVHTVAVRRSFFRDLVALAVASAQGFPALIVRDRSPRYRKLVAEQLASGRFDAIHVDQIKTARHIIGLRGLPPRLIDKHNVYYEMIESVARTARSPLRRLLLRREARTMARYESRACRFFDEILAVTESDARRLNEMTGGERPVTVIPICLDPDETGAVERRAESRDLVCVGAMFYPPNVDGVLWFIREVFPLVRRRVPEAGLRVVGPRPARAILGAAARDKGIVVTGYAEDIAAQYAASAAAVVPIRAGSGMRVKILDAMARGIPVVSTRLGAEGISVADGENILLADSPEDFALAVVRVIRDRALGDRIAAGGRRLVEERYDWRKRYVEVDAVYERLFAAGERRK